MDLSEDFILNLNKFNLTNLEKDIVLGISGGVDSMVLAHLFIENKIPLALCHINFNLRGKESDQDMAFVTDFAKSYGLKLYTKSVDTKEYSKKYSLSEKLEDTLLPHEKLVKLYDKEQLKLMGRQNLSIQMAAREIRYSFFREICLKHNLKYIATAHHLNDSIESFIFNSTKGTGIKGLTGIKYLSQLEDLNVLRPLVNVSKEAILVYARSKNISWREDTSNQSTKYSRNKIRNKVIPILKTINPNLEESFFRTFQRMRLADSFINSEVSALYTKYQKIKDKEIEIDLSLIEDEDLIKLWLIDIMNRYGFNYLIFDQVYNSLGKRGCRFLSDKWVMNIDNYRLFLFPKNLTYSSQEIRVDETENFQINLNDNRTLNFEKTDLREVNYDNRSISYLDYEKISWPITIRHTKPGDKFIPLGMESPKKISDFFIDSKIPRHRRGRFLLIEDSNHQIIAIVGLRPSKNCKVDSTTKIICKIWVS